MELVDAFSLAGRHGGEYDFTEAAIALGDERRDLVGLRHRFLRRDLLAQVLGRPARLLGDLEVMRKMSVVPFEQCVCLMNVLRASEARGVVSRVLRMIEARYLLLRVPDLSEADDDDDKRERKQEQDGAEGHYDASGCRAGTGKRHGRTLTRAGR